MDDEAAPGRGYRDFLGYFRIPVSEFPLTHRDELIDEVSDVRRKAVKRLVRFTHHYSIYGVQSYYTAFHITITCSLSLGHRHVLCSVPYQCCWARMYRKGYHFVVLPSKLDAKKRMGDLCNQHYDCCYRVLSSWEAVQAKGTFGHATHDWRDCLRRWLPHYYNIAKAHTVV